MVELRRAGRWLAPVVAPAAALGLSVGLPACDDDPDDIETLCGDQVDNDGDGLTDCSDDDCSNEMICMAAYGVPFEDCSNGADDDSDGAIDCVDADCLGSPVCP